MIDLKQFEVWFVTGSQHLYGPRRWSTVAEHSREIAARLGRSARYAGQGVSKPVLTTPDAIRNLCLEANAPRNCIGLITWMHTFSPAKMWIAGLRALQKPFVHLHTQFNRDIPVGHHRHGFHEPEPVGARRPRVRLHRQPACA